MVEERRERREELGKDQRRMGGHREVEEGRKRNSMEELRRKGGHKAGEEGEEKRHGEAAVIT